MTQLSRNSASGKHAGFGWFAGVICVGVFSVVAPHRAISQGTYSVSPGQKKETRRQNETGEDAKQKKTVRLVVRDSVLRDVLRALSRQGGRQIVFDDALPQLSKRVSLNIQETSLLNAVTIAVQGTGLVAAVANDGETIVVRGESSRGDSGKDSNASVGQVTGKVIDSASKRGVDGATVMVVGTSISAVTRENGTFKLTNVPAGEHSLSVKLLGYQSKTVRVIVDSARSISVTISLQQKTTTLSGVVTTATGVQRKLEIGNSIASINVDSVMRVAPVTTLTDLLETRVPGLTVQRASGTPGDPARIRLRGSSSIERNNEPIVIVDGIRMYGDQSAIFNQNLSQFGSTIQGSSVSTLTPSPFDQIDPNSIETIDVFKGPSAAAMYGSDAANGVIVIKTKRGRAQPAKWTLTLNTSVDVLPGTYPVGLYQFGHNDGNGILDRSTRFCPRTAFNCIIDSIKSFQALNDSRMTVIGRGTGNDVSLTTSGGLSTLQYSFTGSYGKQVGMLRMPDLEAEKFTKTFGIKPFIWMRRPEQYGTWGIVGNLSMQPSTKMDVTLSSSVFSSLQQRSSLSSAIELLVDSYVDESRLRDSLLLPDLYRRMTSDKLGTRHTANVRWTPVSWLPVNASVGLINNTIIDETFVPNGLIRTAVDSFGRYAVGRGSDKTRSFNISTNVPVPKARIAIATGFTGSAQTVAQLSAQVDTLAPGVLLPTQFSRGYQGTQAGTTYGWFVEPRLNITSGFFVMPGLRLDNNGLSGARAGIMGLPKMNFSWIASDESFFPWKTHINLLRLRTAFGSSGVQPGPQDRLRSYRVATGTILGDGSTNFSTPVAGGRTLTLDQLGNTELRPERSVEVEGGFDTDFWNNRIHLDFTGYRKVKRDAILTQKLPSSVGEGSVKVNVGEVRNTGMEASTSLRVFDRKSASWNIVLSLNRNDVTVVRLNPGQNGIVVSQNGSRDGETRVVAGYPLFGRWIKPILAYADVNSNGILERNEVRVGDSVVYLGRQEPNYTMVINNSATFFGRITINTAIDYQRGATILNQVGRGFAVNGMESPFGAARDAPLSQQVAYAGLEAGTAYGFVQSVSILRFTTLSVTYNVPASLVRRVGGRSVLLSFQGQNLGMKTNYRGKDPLVGATPTGNSLIDNGQMPLPRKFVLRLQIGN